MPRVFARGALNDDVGARGDARLGHDVAERASRGEIEALEEGVGLGGAEDELADAFVLGDDVDVVDGCDVLDGDGDAFLLGVAAAGAPAPPLDARIAGVGDVTGGVWDVASGSSGGARRRDRGARLGRVGSRRGGQMLVGWRLEEDGRAVRVTITSDVAAVCLASPGAAKLPRGVFALEHTAPMVVYSEIYPRVGCVRRRGARNAKSGRAEKKSEDEASRGPRKISRLGAEGASGSYERSVRIRR